MRSTAVFLLALGVLPIALWIPGGLADPGYSRRWDEWAIGIAICIGVGTVAAISWRGRLSELGARLAHRGQSIGAVLRRFPVRADISVAAFCGMTYLVVARVVFAGKPLLIDELVQVLQARMYAAGHLFVPTDSAPEFFSMLHMVDLGERFYSQFPAGWPAMLALGSLLNAEWVVGPLCGAIAVFVFARILRAVYGDESPLTVLGGAAVFGLGSFAVFQFSSHMSHGPVVMWILLGSLSLTRVLSEKGIVAQHRVAWALAAGLAAGCAFAVRPLDAVAFAVPAAFWLLWRARSDRGLRAPVAGAAIGLAIPVALVMWVNVRTTGSPTSFGYEVLWGSSHGLGFHAAPWGDAHTPQRGLELLSLYVTRLNGYLFEAPFPSLLPAIVALAIAVPLTAIERYLLVATGVHSLLYFAYWHDGFYLGPRFVTPWIPILVLLCIRLARHIANRETRRVVRTASAGALGAAVILTYAIGVPVRISQYRSGLTSMRTDYGAEAAAAGATNALVFVRESWGAQLIARLWALGVSRSATAALYRNIDACSLEHGIADAERRGERGGVVETRLRPLMRDSTSLRASTVSPDTTERMLPGSVYDSICSARVSEDRDGYALFPPFLLDRTSGNVYARDFHERDSKLINRFPERRVFVVRRDGVDGTAPLRWIPIERSRAPSASRP
ncbi:MAG: hypothetical protein O2973_09765 [Gemmatimonadetes bacterium]|nr:hypothetical protein [Gemmatimonadota bacterium]